MHPGCYGLPHALFEGETESTVTPVSTVIGQLLGGEGASRSNSLAIEIDEMIDAQVVNIGIVSDALLDEIVGKISAISTNGVG